jgi:hypothetical protein
MIGRDGARPVPPSTEGKKGGIKKKGVDVRLAFWLEATLQSFPHSLRNH